MLIPFSPILSSLTLLMYHGPLFWLSCISWEGGGWLESPFGYRLALVWTPLKVLSPNAASAFQPVAPNWKCLSSSWSRTSRWDSLHLSRNLPHEILSCLSSPQLLERCSASAERRKEAPTRLGVWPEGEGTLWRSRPTWVWEAQRWYHASLEHGPAGCCADRELLFCAPPHTHFQRELPTETALGSASPDLPWDLAWSSWGFLLGPQPTSSSYGLEQELPLSPDSWSTYFHAYKHLEMFHSLHW